MWSLWFGHVGGSVSGCSPVQMFICPRVQDFEMNGDLKMSVIYLLEEVLRDPDLLPQERKATANILRYSSETKSHVSAIKPLLLMSVLSSPQLLMILPNDFCSASFHSAFFCYL